MKNKEQIQKIALIVLLAFGALYTYGSMFLMPKWNQIQQLSEQFHARQAEFEILVGLTSRQTELLEQMKNAEQQLLQESQKIPVSLDKPLLMMNLYNLAKQVAVSPESISFEQVQNKGFYQQITMKFVCIGSSANIINLIRELQSGHNLIAIQNVNFSEQKGLIHLELTLNAYAITSGGASVSPDKPPFMNVPMGAPSVPEMLGR